jgi:hypothetical protein
MAFRDRIPQKTFLDSVEQRLSACSADELRAILLSMAQDTPPGKRGVFLQQLNISAETITAAKQALQEDLLAEIMDLMDELEAAMQNAEEPYEDYEYEYGYGYVDYGKEEVSLPYEEFKEPLQELFDKAEAAYDYGDLALAWDAYQSLSEVLNLEDDYGRGLGIEDLEGVDRDEASARYLRAVYETEQLPDRPSALYVAMLNMRSWVTGQSPMLQDLLEISQESPSDLEQFFTGWIAFLQDIPGKDADAWLREAIRLSQGLPGLETLARSEGRNRPHAYLDWFSALKQEGRYSEVLAGAQEALQTLPEKLPVRAAIADYLCEAAQEINEAEALRAGRWEAFAATPTLIRLLDLWQAYPEESERARQMLEAAQYAQAYMAEKSQRGMNVDDLPEGYVWIDYSVPVHALLLAGDWRTARRLVADQPVLGWSSSSKTQGLVLAFLLVLLSARSPDTLPQNLSLLWNERLQFTLGYGFYSGDYAQKNNVAEGFKQAYAEIFPRLSASGAGESEAMDWCLNVANRRVNAIVGGQKRDSYGKAATLITACAEVLHLRGRAAQAYELLAEVRDHFPRHRSFQSKMKAALQGMESSLGHQ